MMEPWCSSLTQNPPHLSPFHNLVLPFCLFQTSFFIFNVFIHFNRTSRWILPLSSQCSAMQWDIPVSSLPFPVLPVSHCFSFISYLFYLVAHYIAKRFCIEKKNTELFFLYLHVTKISVHRCRSSEETFLIGRFTAPGDCTWVNERVCAHECVFKQKGACMLACRPYPCAYLKCAWLTEGKYGTDRCVLFSVAALEREVLPVGGKRFIFEYQWLFVESVI